MTFVLLLLTFLVVIFTITSGIMAVSALAVLFFKVPFVPTPRKRVQKIIDQFSIKSGATFYDIGCGDGRFIIAAAKRGAKATGYEISPWAAMRARLNIWINKSTAKIKYKNFFRVDLGDADFIFCYLLDSVMLKVEKKLQAELKTGALVGSYGFQMPNWQPEKVVEFENARRTASKLYLYRKT